MVKGKNPKPKATTPLQKIKHSRQLLLVEKLAETVRKQGSKRKSISIGKLMRESGFSIEYSKHPDKLAKSKNFQQLLEEYLPNDKLSKVHSQLLGASRLDHYVFPAGEKDSVIKATIESVEGCTLVKIRKKLNWKRAYFQTPDNQTKMRAISEAYKVKGLYPAEKHEHLIAKVVVVKYE